MSSFGMPSNLSKTDFFLSSLRVYDWGAEEFLAVSQSVLKKAVRIPPC